MYYSQKYLNEATADSGSLKELSGNVAWSAPSNIALIKYWGKHGEQLPMNPSLSLTLSRSVTTMRIRYQHSDEKNRVRFTYNFNGDANSRFSHRMESYLMYITGYLPFLKNYKIDISSENTFPHSSGIASSASAFCALALCLMELEYRIKRVTMLDKDFFTKAAFLARLGSGSACRSVYGGIVEWGFSESIPGSSDEIAIRLENDIHPDIMTLRDSVLIIDSSVKPVSSSDGHARMKENPYAAVRYKMARLNLDSLLSVISEGDMNAFFDLVEYEALTLHAMMMTSFPGFIVMKPSTLEIIERIRQKRRSGMPVGFTIDAGANVHLLYPATCSKEVNAFLCDEFTESYNLNIINDFIGEGPVQLAE